MHRRQRGTELRNSDFDLICFILICPQPGQRAGIVPSTTTEMKWAYASRVERISFGHILGNHIQFSTVLE